MQRSRLTKKWSAKTSIKMCGNLRHLSLNKLMRLGACLLCSCWSQDFKPHVYVRVSSAWLFRNPTYLTACKPRSWQSHALTDGPYDHFSDENLEVMLPLTKRATGMCSVCKHLFPHYYHKAQPVAKLVFRIASHRWDVVCLRVVFQTSVCEIRPCCPVYQCWNWPCVFNTSDFGRTWGNGQDRYNCAGAIVCRYTFPSLSSDLMMLLQKSNTGHILSPHQTTCICLNKAHCNADKSMQVTNKVDTTLYWCHRCLKMAVPIPSWGMAGSHGCSPLTSRFRHSLLGKISDSSCHEPPLP